MSLIEAAVEKAKKLADSGTHRAVKAAPEPPSRPRPARGPQLDEDTVRARAAQARVLPVATVDAEAMERAGVLLQVDDRVAHRANRILRTRVQQQMQAQGWYSMAITAAGAGEGKTLTAINLAITLARDVSTWVYLVDLDLQHPKIASYLGMKFDKGVSDYLAGTAEFDEIVYSPGVERLGIIPNAHPIEYSSDLLGSPRVRALCKALADEVPRPVVIFDLPPLLLSDDVLKFHPNVDCVLLVVSEGVTTRGVLERARETLQDMNLLGVVLNRSSEREDSAYY
jgi:protein-tyrosine kinase